MNKKACVYFHQGWTDIIICFALINYYKERYDEITVLIRSDAQEIVDFYVRNMQGVRIVYLRTDNGRFHGNVFNSTVINQVVYAGHDIVIPNDWDIMFHAEHDRWRKDKYAGYWYQPDAFKKPASHFSEMFYTFYDIEHMTRISYFNVDRDLELEEKTYQEFIKEHGENYVIYHDDMENHTHGSHHVSTQIEFNNILPDCKYVNLNKKSKIFFDYIKVIQNAKEVHLVDSIWGTLCYQLDAKYGIFNGKEINLYCKRGHNNLFLYPVKLDNWKLL